MSEKEKECVRVGICVRQRMTPRAVSCSKATLAQGSWIAAGVYVSMFMEYAFTSAINYQGLFPQLLSSYQPRRFTALVMCQRVPTSSLTHGTP